MRVRRSLSLSVVAILLVASLGATHARRATGITFDVRVTLQTPQGDGGMALLAKARYANGVMRIDPRVVSGAGPMIENEYVIIRDSSSIAVRPGDSTWTEKHIGVGTFTTMMNSINGGSTISEFTVKVDSLGAGDPIEGRPTRHFRVIYSFNTNGRGGARPTLNTYDYWFADLPVPLVNPFDGRTSATGPRKALIAELIPKLADAWAKMGKGTAVKIVGFNTTGYTRRMDLTNIKEAQVDDSVFVIPKGFRRVAP